jgi:hypothetical protein
MTPLKVDEAGLPNGWAGVQPGDAVVAFSRKDIYRARKVCDFHQKLLLLMYSLAV